MRPGGETGKLPRSVDYYTNIIPQFYGNNSGVWLAFEVYYKSLLTHEALGTEQCKRQQADASDSPKTKAWKAEKDLYIMAGGLYLTARDTDWDQRKQLRNFFPDRPSLHFFFPTDDEKNPILLPKPVRPQDRNSMQRDLPTLSRYRDLLQFSEWPEVIGSRGVEVAVPSHMWKVVAILNYGQGATEINESTRIITILTPNNPNAPYLGSSPRKVFDNPNSTLAWKNYRISLRQLEQLTGYPGFLSNVRSEVREKLMDKVDDGD